MNVPGFLRLLHVPYVTACRCCCYLTLVTLRCPVTTRCYVLTRWLVVRLRWLRWLRWVDSFVAVAPLQRWLFRSGCGSVGVSFITTLPRSAVCFRSRVAAFICSRLVR